MGDKRICAYPPSNAGPVLLFDLDELIFAGTETDLFGVSDAGTPIGIGMRNAEGIMRLITVQVLVFMSHLLRALGKHGVRKRGLSHCRVGTSLVYSTGSKLANMPMSLMIGVSFSAWQSQLGLISIASEIWKLGRSCTMACVYSAILQLSTSAAAS